MGILPGLVFENSAAAIFCQAIRWESYARTPSGVIHLALVVL
jgi:hypothetical protein